MSFAGTSRCISIYRLWKRMTDQHLQVKPRFCTSSTKTGTLLVDGTGEENTAASATATSAKPFKAIPGPRGVYNLPYIGFLFHLKPFGNHTTGTVHHLFDEMIERYGPIFKIRLDQPTVVITDPKDLVIMVRNEGKYPHRPNFDLLDIYYKRTGVRPNFAAGQGAEWWRLRAPLQKMLLRPKQLSQYLPQMNKVADDFIQMVMSGYLENHTAEEAFMFYMAESAGTAFFNKRLGFLDKVQSEESKKVQQATLDMFELLLKTLVGSSIAFRYFRSKDYKRFESAMLYLNERSAEYVKEVKQNAENEQKLGDSNSDDANILRSLLSNISEEDVALSMEGLFFASIDSSASGLQLVLHTLAKNPDKQEKLRGEIHKVLGRVNNETNTPVTQEHLDKMPYLKACVKEVYRCYGLVPFGPIRKLPVDTVLGGYNVPAGVPVYNYSPKACFEETIFESPYSYEPERWLRQSNRKNYENNNNNIVGSEASWAVLTFGVGNRMCPGRRLFEQELFLVLTKLLQKTRVGLEPESLKSEFEYRLFLKPVKPLKFTFTPLEVNSNT